MKTFFCFWSSPNFGPNTGLNLSGEFFLLVFIILKFPGPPPFENPAYASVRTFPFTVERQTGRM